MVQFRVPSTATIVGNDPACSQTQDDALLLRLRLELSWARGIVPMLRALFGSRCFRATDRMRAGCLCGDRDSTRFSRVFLSTPFPNRIAMAISHPGRPRDVRKIRTRDAVETKASYSGSDARFILEQRPGRHWSGAGALTRPLSGTWGAEVLSAGDIFCSSVNKVRADNDFNQRSFSGQRRSYPPIIQLIHSTVSYARPSSTSGTKLPIRQ